MLGGGHTVSLWQLTKSHQPPPMLIKNERSLNYDLNLESAKFLELGLCDFVETLFSARH